MLRRPHIHFFPTTCVLVLLLCLFLFHVSCCGLRAFAGKLDPNESYQKFLQVVTKKNVPVIPPQPSDKAAFDKYVQEGWASPFGLDYVFMVGEQGRDPDLVFDFGGVVGVRWADFTRVRWQEIEKTKPKNGVHSYDWAELDDGVRKWQHFGVHILMTLFSLNPWATDRPSVNEDVYLKGPMKLVKNVTADYLPKPEHMQDWRDYIYNLVERYDGDGKDDMPGLLFPILHYQIGNEYDNELFWKGSVEDYKIYLKEAYQAAKRANENVKIVLSGINFGENSGFYGLEVEPRAASYLAETTQRAGKSMRALDQRMNAWSLKAISYCDIYDILDVRWAFYGVVEKGWRLLKEYGCKPKDIWCAEIYAYVPLEPDAFNSTGFLHPYPTPSKSDLYKRVLKQTFNPQFKTINAWYRGLQAAMVVKHCMAALDAGAKNLMMGWAVDTQSALVPFPAAYDGLRSETFKKLWPAAYTYRQVIQRLDGLQSCRRLPTQEYTYVYECTVRDGKTVLVAFYDDFIAQNHDEPLGSARIELPFPARSARVTHIITEIDQTAGKEEQVATENGKLPLLLTEYPVFIQAQ